MSAQIQALPEFSPVEDIFVRAIQEHSALSAGEQSHVGIEFNLPDGWHIYWKNPGDSGLPPTITLKGSNMEVAELHYPAPTRFVAFGIVGYGYKERALLKLPFTVSNAAAESATGVLTANFLMCKDICIPGSFETSLNWTIADSAQQDPDAAALLAEFPTPEPLTTQIQVTSSDAQYFISAAEGLVTGFLPAQNGMIDDTVLAEKTDKGLLVQKDTWQGAVENLSGLVQLDNGAWYALPTTPIAKALAHNTNEASSVEASQSQQNADSAAPNNTFLWLVLSALLAGIILNLMPCVLPILALKVLAFTRPEGKSHVGAYTLGILSGFWAIALTIILLKEAGTAVGWGFHLQNPVFVASLAILMTLISLNLLSVFYLPVPKLLTGHRYATGQGGAFATGLLAVILATPCTVPFMSGAVAYALTQDAMSSFTLFSAMGAGLALPYIVLAYIPITRRLLPAPGAWMETLKNILAFPLFATALWLVWVFAKMTDINLGFTLLSLLLTVSLFVWLYGLAQHKGKSRAWIWLLPMALLIFWAFPILQEKPNTLWKEWSSNAVENTLAQEGIAFVDVTADWCVTCKFTELTVLNRNDAQELFKEHSVQAFRADWTNGDAEISELLAQFNRKGVPLYLVYFPDGRIEVLSQLPTYGEIKKTLLSTE